MTGRTAALLAAAVLLLGLVLRVVSWRDLPPGPWIDETHALRASRSLGADPATRSELTVPLVPPEAGFVNFWVTTPYLSLVALADRAAGGGMAAVRSVSIVPALLLFLVASALARELLAPSRAALVAALLLLASSAWLLSTGRWGWLAVATAALLTASALFALVARRRDSLLLAAGAGALLGAAQYGYPSAWLVLPLPAAVVAVSLGGGREARADARVAGAALAGALLVAAPLLVHYARHPERLLARPRDLAATAGGGGGALAALGANAKAYAGLFLTGGDANERHGDPLRPVLPPVALGLSLVGVAAALRRGGPPRLVAAAALLLVGAGIVAFEETGANAFRISPAAPFLLVLSGVGLEALLALLRRDGDRRRRLVAGVALGAAVVLTSVAEARAFLVWGRSAALFGAFGGPERELADALDSGLRGGAAVEPLLDPRSAARNVFVVEALVGEGGARKRPAIGLVELRDGELGWRRLPDGDVLYAAGDSPALRSAAARLGAVRVATGRELPGFGRWALLRIPAEAARADAARSLSAFPELPPSPGGGFLALEAGLHGFTTRGPVRASLDGEPLFGIGERPAEGTAVARLSAGPHRLDVAPLAPGARLLVAEPHGFVTLALGAE